MGICKLLIASLMFSSEFSWMDSFSLWEMFIFILSQELVLLISLFLRGSLFPWLCSLRVIRRRSLTIRASSLRACNVSLLMGSRWVLLGPLSITGDPPFANCMNWWVPLVCISSTSSSGVSSELGNLEPRFLVDVSRQSLSRSACWLTWLLSVHPRTLCVSSTNVDDRGHSLSSQFSGSFIMPLVSTITLFLTEWGGLSGASCARWLLFVSGASCALLCCLFFLISWQLMLLCFSSSYGGSKKCKMCT